MIYADTDFFLAIIKKEDWLKSGAKKVFEENRGKIVTSVLTIVEIALVAQRENLDVENAISGVFGLSQVEGISIEEGMQAAHYIKNEKLGVFDAFHAVLSKNRLIASSKHIYGKIGKQTIKLEK